MLSFLFLVYAVVVLAVMTMVSLNQYKSAVSTHDLLAKLYLNPNCKVAQGEKATTILGHVQKKQESQKEDEKLALSA
jgi:hypothetical protein